MYKYPIKNAPLWETIYRYGSVKIPYTIINPNNGPTDPLDTLYQKSNSRTNQTRF